MNTSLSIYGLKRLIKLDADPIRKAQEHRNIISKIFNLFVDNCSFGLINLEKKRCLIREKAAIQIIGFINCNIENDKFTGYKLLYATEYDKHSNHGYCIIQHKNEIKLYHFELGCFGRVGLSFDYGELLLKFNDVTTFISYKQKLDSVVKKLNIELTYPTIFNIVENALKQHEISNLLKTSNQLFIQLSNINSVDDSYNNSEAKLLIDNFIKRIKNNKFINIVNFQGVNIDVSCPVNEIVNKHEIMLDANFFDRNEFYCLKDDNNKLEQLKSKYLGSTFILEDISDQDKILQDILLYFDEDKYKFIRVIKQKNLLYLNNHSLTLSQQNKYDELINEINGYHIQKRFIQIHLIKDNKTDYVNSYINEERYKKVNFNLQGQENLIFNDGRFMVHDILYDRIQILSLLFAIKMQDQQSFITSMANIINGFTDNLTHQKIIFKETFTYLYVSGYFPNEGIRNTYLHFLLQCGQLY